MPELPGRKILVVDDDPDNIEILNTLLENEGYQVVSASNGKDALEKVRWTFFSVILLDIRMPKMDGLEVLERLKEESPQSLVIILTAYGSQENVRKACIGGIFDLLDKSIDNKLLMLKIKEAFLHADALLEKEQAKKEIRSKYPYENIIGGSPKLREIFNIIEKVGPKDTGVLVTGESGTGKELVARAIHARSRRPGPFIAVNAGALPETLLETELFGHERGAFTDAKARKFGFFESCENGTIFLDEIAEISPRMQVSLLRVLQEKTITRVGSTNAIKVNARVIAATNKNLEKLVKENTFRNDLYFRIKRIRIHLPPLRERREDIPDLVKHFIKKYSNKDIKISQEALKLLKSYDFPGNIRELEGIIEHILIFLEDNTIHPGDLPPEVTGKSSISEFSEVFTLPWQQAKQLFEKWYIEDKLGKTEWNISEASRISGIDRSDVHKKIEKYGIRKLSP